jgi:hypothetical protein
MGWPLSPKICIAKSPANHVQTRTPWEDSAMSSDLAELGQEAIAAVSRGVADGAPW